MNYMSSQVNLVIRADGSKKIGLGHVVPMITLAHELKRNHFNVVFITFSDPKTLEVLTKNHLPFKTITHPKAFSEIKKIILELEPRLIINNTWQNESLEHFAALKSSGSKIIGFYQTGLGLRECDIVINPLPSSFTDETKVRAKYFQGPKYLIFTPASEKFATGQKNFSEQIRKVVISIGGTDIYDLTPKVEKILSELLVEAELLAISGGLTQMELFEKIHNCDLLVTSGATTLFESAFLGTPTIAIAQKVWEEKTAKYVESRGASIFADLRSSALANLVGTVKSLTVTKRQKMSLAGRKLVDGKGLGRVIAIIKSLL